MNETVKTLHLDHREPRTIGPWPATRTTPYEPMSYVCDMCGDYVPWADVWFMDGFQICGECEQEIRMMEDE